MSQHTKLWTQDRLNVLATNRALEVMQERKGMALPCSVVAVNGPIVTVKFEVADPGSNPPGPWTLPATLEMPIAESQWIRICVQVGDFGLTMPADTFLGVVSGMAPGKPANPNIDYGNMTRLVFVPIGNVDFPDAPADDRPWINGPGGADISDTDQTVGIVIDKTAQTVTIYAGDQTIVIGNDPSITSTVQAEAGGQLQTIVDGAGNAISHVLPTGGTLGLGSLPPGFVGGLTSVNAAVANTDLSTFENSLWTKRLDDLTKFASAMVAAAVPNAGAVIGELATLLHVPVPSGSTSVFLKP